MGTGSLLPSNDGSMQESPGSLFRDLLGFLDGRPDPGTSNVGRAVTGVADIQEKAARDKRLDREYECLTVVLCPSCDDDLAHSETKDRRFVCRCEVRQVLISRIIGKVKYWEQL